MRSTVARTTPYPWPWDGALVPNRLALVIVTPRQVPRAELARGPAWERVRAMVAPVRAAGGVVIHVTTTGSRRLGDGDRAQDLAHDVLADERLEAHGVDGFYASPLDARLRGLGRDQLLLAGAWLETSVHSTLRSANDRGYECLLVLDACLPFEPALVAAARSQIEMSGGIFGAVGESVDVLAALPTRERTTT